MTEILPPDCRDCWFPQEYECTALLQGKPFEPVYLPYMYFKVLRRLDEDTLEVNIGRRDMATDFHETFVRGKEYFDHYLAHQPVYLTLDKRVLYEVKEMLPGAPMSRLLKKVPAAKVAATAPDGVKPMITVQPLNFGPLGGTGFERLVHAYVLQVSQGQKVQWLGEAGGDQGRDIWVTGNGRTTCYQCANYGRLTATKVTGDMDKLARHGHVPNHFILVFGGTVSAALRDKAKAHGGRLGFGDIEVWSGTEFEERLRHHAPVILKRFAEGDPFPEVDGQALASPVAAEADAAVLEFALAPVFALKGSDEELAVFLEEAFYRLEKGLRPAVVVHITEEGQLRALSVQTAASPKTAANRQQTVWLRKIIDMLEEWKAEIAEKVEILYHTDCYPVIGHNGKPINAHPLTLKEMTGLSKILQTAQEKQDSYLKSRGLLPANVLYVNQQANGYAVWYTPPQEVSLFFVDSLNIPSGKYHVPAMVWRANAEHLHVFALKGKVKPSVTTKLCHAPFLNLYPSGQVCMGTVNIDINQTTCLEDFISKWQQYFFNSYFSHSINGNSNTRTDTTELWRSLAGSKEAFPQMQLLPTGFTLKHLLP